MLLAALRTPRDRAMVLAMLHAGIRRCEVLGLRTADVRVGQRQLFIVEGKGGHQRVVNVTSAFLGALGDYLDNERPRPCRTERIFVVLKGPTRGQPLSPSGLDEILSGARRRGGLGPLTCHQLRHTCFTRLREAGMSIEALQAQAINRSKQPSSTCISPIRGSVTNTARHLNASTRTYTPTYPRPARDTVSSQRRSAPTR